VQTEEPRVNVGEGNINGDFAGTFVDNVTYEGLGIASKYVDPATDGVMGGGGFIDDEHHARVINIDKVL
jgi:hypothetical protein